MQSGNVPHKRIRNASRKSTSRSDQSIEAFLLAPSDVAGTDERAFASQFAKSGSQDAAGRPRVFGSKRRPRPSLITSEVKRAKTFKESGPALVIRNFMTVEARTNDPDALDSIFAVLHDSHESLSYFESQPLKEKFFASFLSCLQTASLGDRHRHFFVSSPGGPGVPEYEAVFAYDSNRHKLVACLSSSSKYLRRFLWDCGCEFEAAFRDDNDKLGSELEAVRQSKEIDAELRDAESSNKTSFENVHTRLDKKPLVFESDFCTRLMYALIQTASHNRLPVVRSFFPFEMGVCRRLKVRPPVVTSKLNADGDPIRVVRIEGGLILPGNYVSLAKKLLNCGEDYVLKDQVKTKAFLEVKALPRITRDTSFER